MAGVKTYRKKVESYLGEKKDEGNPLVIRGLTVTERKLIEGALANRFGHQLYLKRDTEVDSTGHKVFTLRVHECSGKERHGEYRAERLERELAKVEEARGFVRVMDAISASRKPLVGHYLALDLLHSIKAFWTDLPPTWGELKAAAQSCFPLLFDTKYIASQPELKAALVDAGSFSLGELRLAVLSDRFPDIPIKEYGAAYGYGEDGEGHLHAAGYDSFVTGSVFLHLAHGFLAVKDPKARASNSAWDIPWDTLRPLANKFAPGRVVDTPYLNLEGDDPVPDRSHVFYLESSGEAWTNTEIIQFFSAWGNVNISWQNKTSAFVALYNKKNAETAGKALVDDKKGQGMRGLHRMKVSGKNGKRDESLSVSVCRAPDWLAAKEADLHLPPSPVAPAKRQAQPPPPPPLPKRPAAQKPTDNDA